jgi:hypothetical protein
MAFKPNCQNVLQEQFRNGIKISVLYLKQDRNSLNCKKPKNGQIKDYPHRTNSWLKAHEQHEF